MVFKFWMFKSVEKKKTLYTSHQNWLGMKFYLILGMCLPFLKSSIFVWYVLFLWVSRIVNIAHSIPTQCVTRRWKSFFVRVRVCVCVRAKCRLVISSCEGGNIEKQFVGLYRKIKNSHFLCHCSLSQAMTHIWFCSTQYCSIQHEIHSCHEWTPAFVIHSFIQFHLFSLGKHMSTHTIHAWCWSKYDGKWDSIIETKRNYWVNNIPSVCCIWNCEKIAHE